MLPGIFIGHAVNSGEGWTEDLIIADWHDIENNVASEVHVKRFKSKEVDINKLQETFIFLCADDSPRKEGHAQRQTSRHYRVRELRLVREYLPLLAWRGVTLCKNKAELQTLLQLIVTLWKLLKISAVCLVTLFISKESSFPLPSKYIDVARQTKPIWKRGVSMIHGTVMEVEVSLKVGAKQELTKNLAESWLFRY